jgi:hypothetical protein
VERDRLAGPLVGRRGLTTYGVASEMIPRSSATSRCCSTKKSVGSPFSGRFGIWHRKTAGVAWLRIAATRIAPFRPASSLS